MKSNFLSATKLTFCCRRSLFSRIYDNRTDEVTNLIKSSGYSGKAYNVETEDGYILTLHRVRPNERVERKGSIFLMHGLFRNSADYLATGPKIALPYFLSDNGYDVFIGNARGSKFSTKHVKHSIKSSEFWNFSWHEIGFFDLAAMIDFASKKSRSSSLVYVGHSQGCTSILALLASRPSYNSSISQLHLMAPAVFLKHSTSPIFNAASAIIVVRNCSLKFVLI
jgi:pimeloyl-ACP methyl ester carboxylesterase